MKKFLGAPYPIIRTPLGLLATQDGVEQIKSDLLCLLLTNPGERVMLPEFGTPLRNLLFEPNDPTLANRAREVIISSIKTWEPRIVVDEIEVTTGAEINSLNPADTKEEIDQVLSIKIMFSTQDSIRDIQTLSLELPLAPEGS